MRNALYDDLLSTISKELGGDSEDFGRYRDNPVAFGEQVLNESYTDDVKAMMESVRDNPVTIAKSSNATGKTHGAARVAAWWFKCFPDSQVYTAAAPPESNLKKLLWGEIGSIIEKFLTGVTIPMSGTDAQRQAKFSGKHAPHLLFIFDEGDAIPDEVYTATESCMSGGHARMLIMFNPRAEAGEVYRMERDGRANVVSLSALDHPNVVTGVEQIPGAVNRETTVRRINEWCRPLVEGEIADGECFELPPYLEGATATSQGGKRYNPLKPGQYKILQPEFSYMVLGVYPAQGVTSLISKEWVARARARWDLYVAEHGEQPPGGTMGVMGLDVAEFGSDANVACFRYGGYVEMPVIWQGVDMVTTGERASEEYSKRNIERVNVDSTGVGAGVPSQMERDGCPAVGVKVASKPMRDTEMGEFGILRDEIWWEVREWLRTDPGAMLPPDELLIEELAIPTYEIANGKIKIMKKEVMRDLLKRSPDRADALCLTFYSNWLFMGMDFR